MCRIICEQISANAHQPTMRFYRRAQKSAPHVSCVKKYSQKLFFLDAKAFFLSWCTLIYHLPTQNPQYQNPQQRRSLRRLYPSSKGHYQHTASKTENRKRISPSPIAESTITTKVLGNTNILHRPCTCTALASKETFAIRVGPERRIQP